MFLGIFHWFVHDARGFVVDTTQAHPYWCFPIAFVIAFTESFVGISFIVPGTILLITLGGVVGASHIGLFPAWLGAVLGSPRLALMFYSISGALVYGYLTFWILRKAGCSWHRIRGTLLQNLVIFAAGGGILLVLEAVQPLAWVPVIAAAFLICIYYGYRLKDEPRIRSSLLRIGGLFGKFDQ